MSNAVMADLLTFARRLTNYDVDATAAGLWVSTQAYTVVVPAGKRWFLYGGAFSRDVSSTCNAYVLDASNVAMMHLGTYTAATGLAGYPNPVSGGAIPGVPFAGIPIDAGEKISIQFAVAQSTAAFATAIVLEVDV